MSSGIKSISTRIKSLCSPAFLYFMLSCIVLVASIIQNAGNPQKYCMGTLECSVGNNVTIFVMKIIYIVLWTFFLDYICKSGYTNVSWFLILLPFISLFFLLMLMILTLNKKHEPHGHQL